MDFGVLRFVINSFMAVSLHREMLLDCCLSVFLLSILRTLYWCNWYCAIFLPIKFKCFSTRMIGLSTRNLKLKARKEFFCLSKSSMRYSKHTLMESYSDNGTQDMKLTLICQVKGLIFHFKSTQIQVLSSVATSATV